MVDGRVGVYAAHTQEALTFVVGRAFLAAVPGGTAPATLEALAGFSGLPEVGIEAVVAVLPQDGPAALASFAVVVAGDPGDDGATVSIVVRGALGVDVFSVGGSRRFTSQGVRPWLLADFQAVTGVVIGSMSAPTATMTGWADTPVGEGIVLGESLAWSVAPAADAADTRVLGVVHDAASASGWDAPAQGDDTVLSAGQSSDADTVLRARPAAGDTATMAPRRRRSAAMIDHPDEHPRYGFRVVGGASHRLDQAYYLGRNPRPPRVDTGSAPALLTVPSRTRAVSGTHLEIRQTGDAVVVTDLGSTNGTTVTLPAGQRERLRHGTSLAVAPGTTLDIGDGNIIEILPASGDESPLRRTPATGRLYP